MASGSLWGSSKGSLARLVLWEAASPVVAGIAVGLLAALFSTRLLRSLLFETSATDPVAITAGIGLLLISALLAALLPARRAMLVEPMRALREQ